jgi:hypothetical protein
MAAPAVVRITNVTETGGLHAGIDDRVIVGIQLNVVERITAMAVFTNTDLFVKG